MMAATQNMTVRVARDEDYEAVLDINRNFLMGVDYIYFSYYKLINDPDFTYYVCEVDGEVAAFEGVALIDDNKTLMTRSARVKDTFQGKGLLSLIRKKIYEDYKNVPGEKRIRTSCTSTVRLVNSAKFRSQNKTLAKIMRERYQPVETIKLPTAHENILQDIKQLDTDDLANIFSNKNLVNYLFPTGFLAIASWFYDPLISNIRHIKKHLPYISISASLYDSVKRLASVSNDKENFEKFETHFCEENGDPMQGLLAINSYYVTPNLILFTFDIYGTTSQGNEEEELQRIIVQGLQYAKRVLEIEQFKYPLSVALGVNDETYFEICKKIMAALEFEQGELKCYECHFYFEQEFEKLLSD